MASRKRRRYGRTQREGARHSREKRGRRRGKTRTDPARRSHRVGGLGWTTRRWRLRVRRRRRVAGPSRGDSRRHHALREQGRAAAAAAYRRWFPTTPRTREARRSSPRSSRTSATRLRRSTRRVTAIACECCRSARGQSLCPGRWPPPRRGCAAVGERRARQPRRGPRASRVPAHVLPRDPGHRA